jgi:protein-disulfide isomerase
MASLAALEAEKGALGPEIILSLGGYYQSFGQKRAALKPDGRMCRGAASAQVTLVEFFDYECPACGAARPSLDTFAKAHPEYRLCVMPFPLSGHPNALPAGQAALFARDKGKFWVLHDLLFENQRRLSPQVILELAGQVGLNVPELRKAMDAGRYLEELKASREAGIQAGVESTPSVFVNGHKLGLPVEPEILTHAAEDELEWSSHKNAWAAD